MSSTSRKNKLRSGILFGFLGLALVAMVVTGFGTDGMGGLGGMGGGQQAETLVEIGDEELTDVQVSDRLNFAYRQMISRQPDLDREQFFATNFDAMLEELIDSRVLRSFARRMGMVIPQTMIDRLIVTNPAFQNVAGQYDDAAFRAFLQQQDVSERELRDDLETAQIIRMVTAPISGGGRVPEAVAQEFANLLLESRTGQLGAIPAQLLAQGLQPSDQEIAAFYQQNQRLFALPERRVLRYALIGRDQLGDAVRATDQEVAAYYQQNQAQYGPGETRNLQLFTTQDEAAARRLAERVRGGTSFIEAAQAEGFSAEDVNLPNLRREQAVQRTSEEVANAAFRAQQGELVGPIRTQIGFQVVRVDGINRTPGRPIEAVRGEIVAAIEQRKLAEQINARVEQIDEQLADGASFEDVARSAGLQLQTTPPMSSTGAAPNFQFPQELTPLVAATFELDPDSDPEIQVVQPDRLVAIVQVADVVAPAAPPLDQIRDQVRARLVQQTALQRARAVAEGIVNRINGGMTPAQAYAQAGIRLPNPEPVSARRFQIARAGQEVPPPLRILFSIPEGRARMIAAPNNTGWIVVHHVRRVPGNPAEDPSNGQIAAATREQLGQAVQSELQSQFARAIRSIVEVERNEERINALRERLRAGQ